MEPIIMPLIKNLCINGYTIRTGNIVMNIVAIVNDLGFTARPLAMCPMADAAAELPPLPPPPASAAIRSANAASFTTRSKMFCIGFNSS